jgi:hypothetical protein
MRRLGISLLLASGIAGGCAQRAPVTQGTLAEIRDLPPDVEEARVEQGLEQAMESYRRFLEEAPETAMTPEAMRRLADLQLEQQFGISTEAGTPREMPAPQLARSPEPREELDPGTAFPGTGPEER